MPEQPLGDRLRALREVQEAQESSLAAPEPAPVDEPRPEPSLEPELPVGSMRLGELLVAKGLLSEGDLVIALGQQRQDGRPLGEILLGMGAVTQGELARTLTEQRGFDSKASLRRRLGAVDEPEPEETFTTEPAHEPDRYVVRESGDAEPLHVAESFLDAADAAFELIEERDPAQLEIVRTGKDEGEQLWSYRREEADSAPPAA